MQDDLYLRLSPGAQNVLSSLHGYRQRVVRYGSSFDSILSAAHQRSILPPDELKNYQNNRLLLMLRTASFAPYWSERFSDYSINLNSDDGFAELKKLPILVKSDIQSCSNKLLPDKSVLKAMTRYPLISVKTSGTTGAGLRFFSTREAEKERWAMWWRYRQSNGIQRTMWCLTFAGRAVVSPKQSKPPYWRYNYPGRQILFSAYHLSDLTAELYLRKIRESRAPWLHGYPSFLALIAGYVLDCGIDFPCIRYVTTGAEKLHGFQRRLIEKAFKVKVYDHYGQAEGVANFSQFSSFNHYVVDEDYAFVEFIPSTTSSQLRIVGTNLVNPAFPLFRYEVGDIALPAANESPPYGSFQRCLAGIDGRSEDYLVLSDGSRVGRLDHIFKDLTDIVEAQFVQHCAGEVDLLYVTKVDDDALIQQKLILMTRRYLGDKISVYLRRVPSVPRTSAGKLKFVVSSVSLSFFMN